MSLESEAPDFLSYAESCGSGRNTSFEVPSSNSSLVEQYMCKHPDDDDDDASMSSNKVPELAMPQGKATSFFL